MTNKSLSQPTLDLINDYQNLEIGGKKINTPYFNNCRSQVRAGLRVLIGKGTPKDIAEEALILSLREKVELDKMSGEEITKFLVDHNIGIDCSGFVYHILNTELKSQNKKSLNKVIRRPWVKNPLRKMIAKLRSVENTGVSTFGNPANSTKVNLDNIQPGDMITMINTGSDHNIHHVLLVYKIENKTIHYVHSFKYSEDGQYNHGIKKESLEITDPTKSLLEQKWQEPRMLEHARQAQELKIVRIK